jgi:hypothetical protein
MGVDTRILLPDDVRVDDVAYVMGALAGLKPTMKPILDGEYAIVEGVTIKNSSVLTCCEIELNGDMVDGENYHRVLYHFEAGRECGRLMLPPSTPFWQEMGKRLVDFFGGKVDLADCDAIDWDVECKKPRESNSPEDGEEWQFFQHEIFNLKPIDLDNPEPCVKVNEDEFTCVCGMVCDVEDTINFQGERVCTFCGEGLLKQRNNELVANEIDSVCERDY